MKQETGKLLYSSSDMTNLLGHFIIYPKEILDKVKYKLSTEDFNRPYNWIFGAIENIAEKGAEKITEENSPKVRTLTPGTSQIDKFNARWNK